MIQKKIKDLDLQQIAQSGQCFRMERQNSSTYSIIAHGEYLEITQHGEDYTLSCSEKEFQKLWREYLDLDTDYGEIKNSIDTEDSYLNRAANYGWGIRILKQDLWEMIITFLISQNNNIPRIRNSVRRLCEAAGEKRDTRKGSVYFTFPSPEAVLEAGPEVLGKLGLGYREKYICRMAEAVAEGSLNLEKLKKADYESAHKELMLQYGIGRKVAGCICLFGLYHVEAFPVDTHIKRILDLHYPEGFPYLRYQGYAGILQQYMFYYDLNQEGREKKENTISYKRGFTA